MAAPSSPWSTSTGSCWPRAMPHDGLPAETVASVTALQIADALAHAHEHGVLHRDLKTANIAIGAVGRARCSTSAWRVASSCAASTRSRNPSGEVETARVLAGTLPVHAAGGPPRRADDDPRSDIWSLGVVLFEMATGELPFKGRNEFESDGGHHARAGAAVSRARPADPQGHHPALPRQGAGPALSARGRGARGARGDPVGHDQRARRHPRAAAAAQPSSSPVCSCSWPPRWRLDAPRTASRAVGEHRGIAADAPRVHRRAHLRSRALARRPDDRLRHGLA